MSTASKLTRLLPIAALFGSLVACGGGSSSGDEESIEPQSLSDAIQGAWQGECIDISLGDGSFLSAREIVAITDSRVVRDWYEYDGAGCTGAPRGQYFPMDIFSYAVGNEIQTDEGLPALELNLVGIQQSDLGFDPFSGPTVQAEDTVGQNRFVIVGTENGQLLWPSSEPTDSGSRPTSLSVAKIFDPRVPITAATITPENFMGTFVTACISTNSDFDIDEVWSVFTETHATDSYVLRKRFYDNEACSGDPLVITSINFQKASDGSTVQTIFGDTMLPLQIVQDEEVLELGAEFIGLETLAAPRDLRYTSMAIVDGDIRMYGDCVLRVADCKILPNVAADMIDLEFDSFRRYRKVE